MRRPHRSRKILVFAVEIREPRPSAEDLTIALDLLRRLRFATTPERWEAWIAHAEGKTVAEVAEETGRPIGTVATLVRLARRDFQAAISRLRAAERRGSR